MLSSIYYTLYTCIWSFLYILLFYLLIYVLFTCIFCFDSTPTSLCSFSIHVNSDYFVALNVCVDYQFIMNQHLSIALLDWKFIRVCNNMNTNTRHKYLDISAMSYGFLQQTTDSFWRQWYRECDVRIGSYTCGKRWWPRLCWVTVGECWCTQSPLSKYLRDSSDTLREKSRQFGSKVEFSFHLYFVSSRERPWHHSARHRINAAKRIICASIPGFLF